MVAENVHSFWSHRYLFAAYLGTLPANNVSVRCPLNINSVDCLCKEFTVLPRVFNFYRFSKTFQNIYCNLVVFSKLIEHKLSGFLVLANKFGNVLLSSSWSIHAVILTKIFYSILVVPFKVRNEQSVFSTFRDSSDSRSFWFLPFHFLLVCESHTRSFFLSTGVFALPDINNIVELQNISVFAIKHWLQKRSLLDLVDFDWSSCVTYVPKTIRSAITFIFHFFILACRTDLSRFTA